MKVNYEFLGDEPIENVITCMNFRIDKVVFFGYHDVIQKQQGKTQRFLESYCGVHTVIFHALQHKDLASTVKMMGNEIEQEIANGSDVYFDITGGESLILVAFGMLASKYEAPIHFYDIPSRQLIEAGGLSKSKISSDAEKQYVAFDLDRHIEMHGGAINYHLHKGIKDTGHYGLESDMTGIWEVASRYSEYWNQFSALLREKLVPDAQLHVDKKTRSLANTLSKSKDNSFTLEILDQILVALSEKDIILDLELSDESHRFRIKNKEIKDCLWESGSALEWHVYQEEAKESDDCLLGVHLDWDGELHTYTGVDVLNEIDILSLTGYVPHFISCKGGNLNSHRVLHALYELDTVARRFGGKYARKTLVTTTELGNVYRERAEEMEIAIECI